jgi:tetratricopeptide (TPR) repeat protein
MRNNTMNAQSNSSLARLAATLVLSAAVVGATGFVSAVAADKDKKEENKVSKDLAKPLKAAQDALQAKKYQDALAKLKEAEGNPKKTPYDEHVINVLAGSAYARTNDYPDAEKAFEVQANDGFTDQADLPRIVKAVAQINYQLKNYDKAIEFGNRAIKSGQGDEEINIIVGQSYYLKGDYKGTLKFLQPLIDGDIKAGRTPKDQQLQDQGPRKAGDLLSEARLLEGSAVHPAAGQVPDAVGQEHAAALPPDVRGGRVGSSG